MLQRSLILLFLHTAVMFGQSSLNDSLSSRLSLIRTKYKLAGISVTVFSGSKILASGSSGLADISRSRPVTDSTLYRIASISKTVAATALMQLYDQGKFALDQDVNPALGFTLRNPYYPNDPITYRMLLSHTSGIQDGTGYNDFLAATSSQNIPPISSVLVQNGVHYTSNMWQNRKPGTYFAYTNMGFGVIGTLVERLSNQRFDRYCSDNIFKPLGIEASFNVHDLRNINNLAVLYRTSGTQWVPQLDNYQGNPPPARDLSSYVIGSNGSLFGPQGNLRISAKDLAVFMIARANNGIVNGVRILSDSTARRMNEPMWTFNGLNGDNYYGLFRRWGLGTHLTTNTAMGDIVFPGRSMAGHPGEAYGLISDAYLDLNTSVGVVFVTNGKEGAYSFGTQSAFYDVEEAVFTAAYNFILTAPTIVETQPSVVASRMVLRQNYPNPFNPVTTIEFSVPENARTTVTIYSSLGQRVATLYDDVAEAGRTYRVPFVAAGLSSGVYMAQVEFRGAVERKRMLLVK